MLSNRLAVTITVVALSGAGCAPSADDEGNVAGSGMDVAEVTSAVTSPVCIGATTVPGLDVSFYQGSINWTSVAGAGYRFAIARVSDGLNTPDSKFTQNWAGIKAAGLMRGSYQFFEPSQDAVAQADMLLAAIGTLGRGDLPPMLDVESAGGQSAATVRAKIHQWVDRVQAVTGRQPLIYTGAYFWDASVGGTDFVSYPTVIASYGTTCPRLPNGYTSFAFHQYSSTGQVPGIAGNVDLDKFNGSLAQLEALTNGTVNHVPVGHFDSADADLLRGWAQDSDDKTATLSVQLYFDGTPTTAGVVSTSVVASVNRPDLCAPLGSCTHAFSVATPRQYCDGQAHTIDAWALDSAGGPSAQLENSPRSLTCPAPTLAGVRRSIVSPADLTAWKFSDLFDLIAVSAATLGTLPAGDDFSPAPVLVRTASQPDVYVLDTSFRRLVPSTAVADAWRLDLTTAQTITDAELAAYPLGPELRPRPLLVQNGTAIYAVDDAFPFEPMVDGGVGDAGQTDLTDAGTTDEPDAGATFEPDAGGTDLPADAGEATKVHGGCSAAASAPSLAAALAMLAAARRRRRS